MDKNRKEKNKIKILYIITALIFICISIIIHIFLSDVEKSTKGEETLLFHFAVPSAELVPVEGVTEVTKEYKVIKSLETKYKNKDENYYVIGEVEKENFAVVKVSKDYQLEENKNYMFSLTIPLKDYGNIEDIERTFDVSTINSIYLSNNN